MRMSRDRKAPRSLFDHGQRQGSLRPAENMAGRLWKPAWLLWDGEWVRSEGKVDQFVGLERLHWLTVFSLSSLYFPRLIFSFLASALSMEKGYTLLSILPIYLLVNLFSLVICLFYLELAPMSPVLSFLAVCFLIGTLIYVWLLLSFSLLPLFLAYCVVSVVVFTHPFFMYKFRESGGGSLFFSLSLHSGPLPWI